MTPIGKQVRFSRPSVYLFAFASFLVCLATLSIYWPGLSGSFLLDDTPNLKNLSQNLTIDTYDRLKQFVLSGSSGPTGRPLSLLSFLINDTAWPSEARTFKYTNLFIHLLNGVLITWLLILLLSLKNHLSDRRVVFMAIAVAAFWLLHPLNVSTTLYAVQRMSMLATLFTLIGLVCYVKGRIAEKPNYIVMSIGVATGGTFGVLCKENAILLPLFIIIIEYTLIRSAGLTSSGKWRIWAVVFLVIPISLLIGWHVFSFDGIYRSYVSREFSLVERLLTQPRVLADYAYKILIPVRTGTGVFGDDFVISNGMLKPTTTIIALIGGLLLISAALLFRKRFSVFSFAILWFISGHSLEAGIIPLEIYFEHRNYLPIVGLLLGIVYGLHHLPTKISKFGIAAVIGLIVISGFATWQNTTLWGNPALLSQVWAQEHPKSIRAQQFAASFWFNAGSPSEAAKYIQRIVDSRPDTISAHLTILQLRCIQGAPYTTEGHQKYKRILGHGSFDLAVPEAAANIMQLQFRNKCPGLSKQVLDEFFTLLLANTNLKNGKTKAELYYRQALFFETYNEYNLGIDALEQAMRFDKKVDLALVQANMYIALDDYENALNAVSKAEKMDKNGPLKVKLRTEELKGWRDFIVARIEENERED